MVLGRLMHYAGDALLISEPTTKGLLEKYLGFGEFVFDSSVAAARASSLFQKDLVDRLQGRPAP
jgi:hypothetical protein